MTGFLSLSRSTVIGAPEEIMRARWLASNTSSNRFSTLSMQSSTVTRAIISPLLTRKGFWKQPLGIVGGIEVQARNLSWPRAVALLPHAGNRNPTRPIITEGPVVTARALVLSRRRRADGRSLNHDPRRFPAAAKSSGRRWID